LPQKTLNLIDSESVLTPPLENVQSFWLKILKVKTYTSTNKCWLKKLTKKKTLLLAKKI